jgi:molybdopterin molybdotransferase
MNIRKQGQDLIKGNIALTKNTRLQAHHIAVAASCGKKKVKVYKRLRIGILATGDELVDIEITPDIDKIRCSNLYSLLSAVREINMLPVNLGIAKDKKQLIYDKLKNALDSDLDILITTGGVSVGKFDYVKEVHEELGIDLKFHGVRIKPGKPTLFGTFQKQGKSTLVFGLPGNPVSSLVNFYLFVQQNIFSLFEINFNTTIIAQLKDDLAKKDSKRHFMRGTYTYNDDGTYSVHKVGSQSSGNLAEMGLSNCLIIVEEERINPQKGEKVKCITI